LYGLLVIQSLTFSRSATQWRFALCALGRRLSHNLFSMHFLAMLGFRVLVCQLIFILYTPTTPLDEGDCWVQVSNDNRKCATHREFYGCVCNTITDVFKAFSLRAQPSWGINSTQGIWKQAVACCAPTNLKHPQVIDRQKCTNPGAS
jgi:hypothetical protein